MSANQEIFFFEIPISEIKISRGIVKESMGYNQNEPNDLIDDLIDKYLDEAQEYIIPSGGFRIFAPEAFVLKDDNFEIDGNNFNAGKIISGQLKKSKSIAIFAVSAGSGIDSLVKKLNEADDPLSAFIVNTIGSEAAEQIADAVETILGKILLYKGLKHTNRFSPGYCDWSVGEQHLLFSLLPDGFAGIKLTESALMTPIKSISGIIGIGPDAVKKGLYMFYMRF